MTTFDINQSQFILFFLLGSLIVLVFLFPPTWTANLDWVNTRYILQAGVPTIIFGYYFLQRRDSIQIYIVDIYWGLFLIIGFFSFFWSINSSLIWYHVFAWSSLILWSLSIRYFTKDIPKNLAFFFLVFFLVLLLLVLRVWLQYGLDTNNQFVANFGYNHNIVTFNLVCLLPFFLFYPISNVENHLGKSLIVIVVAYFTYKAGARGNLLLLGLILSIYTFLNFNRKTVISLVIVVALSLVFALVWNNKFINPVNLLDSVRWQQAKNSFFSFLEHPLLGGGLGNWHLDAYRFGLNNDYAYTTIFVRYGNHNFYAQHLSELGIIGFTTFLYPIVRTLYKGFKNIRQASDFQKAVLTSTLVCFMGFAIYRDAFFYEYHYSGILLFAFCMLGLIKIPDEKQIVVPRWGLFIGIILSLACTAWFIYAKKTDEIYKKAIALGPENPRSIFMLKSIYHPVFKTTNGFKDISQSFNNLIAADIAERLVIVEEYELEDKVNLVKIFSEEQAVELFEAVVHRGVENRVAIIGDTLSLSEEQRTSLYHLLMFTEPRRNYLENKALLFNYDPSQTESLKQKYRELNIVFEQNLYEVLGGDLFETYQKQFTKVDTFLSEWSLEKKEIVKKDILNFQYEKAKRLAEVKDSTGIGKVETEVAELEKALKTKFDTLLSKTESDNLQPLLSSISSIDCIPKIDPVFKNQSAVLQDLKPTPSKGFYSIDTFDEQVIDKENKNNFPNLTKVRGWAVDSIAQQPTDELWVALDTFMFKVHDNNLARPDVAAAFNKPSYENSGFETMIFTNGLNLSEADLSLIIIDRYKGIYYPASQQIPIQLSK